MRYSYHQLRHSDFFLARRYQAHPRIVSLRVAGFPNGDEKTGNQPMNCSQQERPALCDFLTRRSFKFLQATA